VSSRCYALAWLSRKSVLLNDAQRDDCVCVCVGFWDVVGESGGACSSVQQSWTRQRLQLYHRHVWQHHHQLDSLHTYSYLALSLSLSLSLSLAQFCFQTKLNITRVKHWRPTAAQINIAIKLETMYSRIDIQTHAASYLRTLKEAIPNHYDFVLVWSWCDVVLWPFDLRVNACLYGLPSPPTLVLIARAVFLFTTRRDSQTNWSPYPRRGINAYNINA